MPTVETNDGVMNINNYDGVKTDLEFITKALGALAGLLLVIGIFRQSSEALWGAGFMAAGFLFSFGFTAAHNVLVLQDGKWNHVGKFRFAKANEIKAQLINEMNTK